MAAIQPIKIDGLAEFSRNLKKLDNDLPKALRIANNEAANLIVDYARPRVPKDSGRAAKTVKAKSTRTEGRVSGGSAKYPYYPWLDFGGRVGKNRSVKRPYLSSGRYMYAGLSSQFGEIMEVLNKALIDVARQAGVEVEKG
jgi:hypothetical protein